MNWRKLSIPADFTTQKPQILKIQPTFLLEKHEGRVPDTMEELLSLPGVGRKTANLILSDIYKKSAVVTDTHCIRIANRLGLATSKGPVQGGKWNYPSSSSLKSRHRSATVSFISGRDICLARSPKCDLCPLSELCSFYIENQKS